MDPSSKAGKAVLTKERSKASFKTSDLAFWIAGSKEAFHKRHKIFKDIASNPVFDKSMLYFMDRKEHFSNVLEKRIHAMKYMHENGLTEEGDGRFVLEAVLVNAGISLHSIAFIPTFESQMSQEQQDKWLHKAKTFQIIGSYAQTELGHGSNVRALESTATYDPASEQFVLHSPTLTSTKFWPGGLGKVSTHTLFYARLIIKGKDYGIHIFLVQLRDLSTHEPLAGVTVGDIGPKLEFEGNDNGYLRLDHVRIPRDQMLNRFAKVTAEGRYIPPSKEMSKIIYASMLKIRIDIADYSHIYLSRAATIATRYSCIRKQFGHSANPRNEISIIDHKNQQYRLFTALSTAYTFVASAKAIRKSYDSFMETLKSGSINPAQLNELHATACTIKALSTQIGAGMMEELRKSLGGHGYNKASEIGVLCAAFLPACTYEGDNYVLYQQTTRYLLKILVKASTGASPLPVSYLDKAWKVGTSSGPRVRGSRLAGAAASVKSFLSLDSLLGLWGKLCRAQLIAVGKTLFAAEQKGVSRAQAWNDNQIAIIRVARSHGFFILLQSYIGEIRGQFKGTASSVAVMERLAKLFALYWMSQELGSFLEHRVFLPTQAKHMHSAINQLLSEIRPDAVALVDAFGFTDYVLNSSLGRFNGDDYEHLFNWAHTKNPMNKDHKPPGYSVLRDLIDGKIIPQK